MTRNVFGSLGSFWSCVAAGVIAWGCSGALAAGESQAAGPKFTKTPDGAWEVSTKGYRAVVDADGRLSSLKVGGVETVGEPLAYQPRAKLLAVKIAPAGEVLSVTLKAGGKSKDEATIDYRFRPDGVTIEPTWRGGGYAEFRFTASEALLGIELLNDKSVTTGADAMRFAEAGEVRGVPAVPSARNQMVRFQFPSFGLHAYVQAWGAPFNYESAGSITGRSWGRSLMQAGRAFPIIFTIQPGANPGAPGSLRAPVFVPRTDKVCSLYYADEPCRWSIDLGPRKACQYLLDAGVSALKLSWKVTDIHDRTVADGQETLALDAAADPSAKTVRDVTIRTPGSGYYQVLFGLSEPSGKMLASSFLTRFTVINRVDGFTNRDDSLAGKDLTDYAVVAMIGAGCIRESHNIGGFLANQERKAPDWLVVEGTDPIAQRAWMNVKELDRLFNRATEQSRKYGLTWFFQANSRPSYATPPVYEAIAHALVSRYKDRCRIWEVENEPNFSYTPADYVEKCLIPFYKGAKRADPGCVVMGPGGCGVRDTLRFMEHIYSVKANRYLDNISTHTYPGPGESWAQFGNLATIGLLKEWMSAHGDGSGQKRLWQTEQGYRWQLAPKAEAARYATRQFLQGWRLGIEPACQYYFYPQSHGFESWYQVGGGEEGSRHSWLPVAAAQRFFAENTFGLKFAGDVPSPYKGIYLPRFAGAKGDVVAAWTFDFPYTLAVKADGVRRVVGYMGNAAEPKPDASGALHLRVCGEPIYIHLAKGAKFEVLSRDFGANLAAAAGATAEASSSDNKHPPALAIDGNWNLWENAATLPGRTAWISGRKDPTPAEPDRLTVTFSQPRTIDRIVALCYLPAVNPSPRDFEFQVQRDGKWVTVGSGHDEFTWCPYREFPPVKTSKIRLVVTRINDGWHGDRKWMHVLMGKKATNYTDSKLRVSELEAYGPS